MQNNNLPISKTNSTFNPIAEKITIGTCSAEYELRKYSIQVFEFLNNDKHNGHFDFVLNWLEAKCQKEKKDLIVSDIVYQFFQDHLIVERGFKKYKGNSVIKQFKFLNN